MSAEGPGGSDAGGFWQSLIGWFVDNRLIVFLLAAMLVVGGMYVSPFAWQSGSLPRDPVPVDAIPDIGENQQIVFTEWEGRSPQDVEQGWPLKRSTRSSLTTWRCSWM